MITKVMMIIMNTMMMKMMKMTLMIMNMAIYMIISGLVTWDKVYVVRYASKLGLLSWGLMGYSCPVYFFVGFIEIHYLTK